MVRETLTRFPEIPYPISAAEYYQEFVCPKISDVPRNEVYFSATSKSGGVISVITDLPSNFTNDQRMSVIFAINANIAKSMIGYVEHYGYVSDGMRRTLPHFIPQAEHWQEFDFVRFWMYYISGIDPESAFAFEETTRKSNIGRLDGETANKNDDQWRQRLEEYGRLLNLFSDFIKSSSCKLNPLSRMFMLHGYQYSLGCRLELQLAHILGIRVDEVLFDQKHPDYTRAMQGCLGIIDRDPSLRRFIGNYSPQVPVISSDGRRLVRLRELKSQSQKEDFSKVF